MQKAKKILLGIWILLIHIILTGYFLVRKIVLPGRNRKGNVLGSLFLFFIAIAEKLIVFEQNILHSSWLIRNRFIKQGLIIAAAFLFLVSSVEWTANINDAERSGETEAIVITPIDKSIFPVFIAEQVNVELPEKRNIHKSLSDFSPPSLTEDNSIHHKRFLLFCVLRI